MRIIYSNLNKQIGTVEYYAAIKRKILPFATAWMDMEIIMLNEKSQSEEDKYHMISLFVESNEQKWTVEQNRNRGMNTWNNY